MKLYVASRFHDYVQARAVMDYLTGLGHTITFDWTRSSEFDAMGKLIVEPAKLPTRVQCGFAEQDMIGVLGAEGLVLLWEPDMAGAYIEVGIALVACIPVFVIGAKRFTIFWAHPLVEMFPTIENFYDYLMDDA